jgi:hypothetical protein
MKKLTCALVLSFSLLLITGCRSAGETRDAEDASTGSSSTPHDQIATIKAAEEAIKRRDAGPDSTQTAQPTQGGDVGGTTQGAGADQGSTTGKGSTPGSGTTMLSDSERQAQESCLDKWLKEKKLDRYGHPEGTMYAGGTPLFNEMTGESRDRLDYVYERQPEARKLCAAAKSGTPENTKGIPPKKK